MLQVIMLIALLCAGAIGYMLLWLVMAACTREDLILLNTDGPKSFLGQPLLFPAKLAHARRFPDIERYNYWYDYFVVGIPVGLRGRIGNLLSIDNLPAHESHREKCWFTIDPAYYLDRGSGDLCLREKLDIFLESLDEDPRSFPYAYLISTPRFLWWQKSAISYWYLYSSSRELTAMIMEINNSFFEKRNVFFRISGDIGLGMNTPPPTETVCLATMKEMSERQAVRFVSSAPTSKIYKGTWTKRIFASPFEKMEGVFTNTFVDPLPSEPNPRGTLQSTLTSVSAEGRVKVNSRLSSWSKPVNPISASWRDVTHIILRWTHVGAISSPRIIKEALRIRFRGMMEYHKRPEVRPGSIPRNQTVVERALERVFREYLSHITSRCQYPVTVVYAPPRSLHFNRLTFQSPVPPTSSPRTEVTVQPLTPRFYTRIAQYRDVREAFPAMAKSHPTSADHLSCFLWVSDMSALDHLLTATAPAIPELKSAFTRDDPQRPLRLTISKGVIAWLRGSNNETFMDSFCYWSQSQQMQREYQKAVIHHLLANKLPVESQAAVMLCYISLTTVVVYLLLHLLAAFVQSWRLGSVLTNSRYLVTPSVGALVYGGWAMLTKYVGKYYLNPFAWGDGL
ncbi:hypothetical protein NUU61_002929 [Penicillium alfredii]|uniref:Uncharacterized protein n=1 Tax=Penicillium alfredii TaxID=1506179 RepID=A0A9W9FSL1_9EURO|nr:uncharacterized protein NUU61_002929 [Penicillium alfredii]KAJ5105582.1 hypothetical protein NUU61_002929 [Penicillium alfredii]